MVAVGDVSIKMFGDTARVRDRGVRERQLWLTSFAEDPPNSHALLRDHLIGADIDRLNLLDVDMEAFAVDRAIEEPRGVNPVVA